MISGSFVIETIFHIPGLGRFFVNAAINQDYTMILGTTLLYCILIMGLNLLADILQQMLNPSKNWRNECIFQKESINYLGHCVVGHCAVLCGGALFLAYDYAEQNLELGISAPSAEHWFGTDIFGARFVSACPLWGANHLGCQCGCDTARWVYRGGLWPRCGLVWRPG